MTRSLTLLHSTQVHSAPHKAADVPISPELYTCVLWHNRPSTLLYPQCHPVGGHCIQLSQDSASLDRVLGIEQGRLRHGKANCAMTRIIEEVHQLDCWVIPDICADCLHTELLQQLNPLHEAHKTKLWIGVSLDCWDEITLRSTSWIDKVVVVRSTLCTSFSRSARTELDQNSRSCVKWYPIDLAAWSQVSRQRLHRQRGPNQTWHPSSLIRRS